MTTTFQTTKSHLPSTQLALTSPLLPTKHWSKTCHETILVSKDPKYSIELPLAGGSDNGQFVYFTESISLLKNSTSSNIIKGGKIDVDEIVLEVDDERVAGYTLAEVQQLIETCSSNGNQILLKTVKPGLTKDLRQFLDGRFEKKSPDHQLQQTIRDNLYTRTVPCTTRPSRPGEINGQDYTFLSVKDFQALEKSGKLLESGVYKGHYYGTPRPTKGTITTNSSFVRRSNSANEMFQRHDPEIHHNQHVSGELIRCSLRKGQHGFGFTIIDGHENGEQFLQIKDIITDGAAAKDGRLQRGDILVYINETYVLGYNGADVRKIFQSLPVGDMVDFTVCRGYPLVVNVDDPYIDIVSLNGVHHLPNGGYQEYQPEKRSNTYTVKVRKGPNGFGFTLADSPSGQLIKSIFEKQRCQHLCEDDLLLSVNGKDLSGKNHHDVVAVLSKCAPDKDATFVVRRGDQDINNNHSATVNGNNYFDRNSAQFNNRSTMTRKHVSFLTSNKENKENSESDIRYLPSRTTENPRSKTPTSFSPAPSADTLPLRSRTPTLNKTQASNTLDIPLTSRIQISAPIAQTEFSSEPLDMLDEEHVSSRSMRLVRPHNPPLIRSKTPGPDFGTTKSASYRAPALKPRSKTPTAYEFAPTTFPNSRSLQSMYASYYEIIVNLTILRPTDGFGLRIVGGEEEKSQVRIGHIVPNSPAAIDGRLCVDDEIVKIDDHSTIRASHTKVVQLMQRARENQHVCLTIRRYTNSDDKNKSFRRTTPDSYATYQDNSNLRSSVDGEVRHLTLHKATDHDTFGFVIISSQNQIGPVVGKIIRNSPADQCGELHVNDRILAVNGIDLSEMLHTDVVNLIKESGRIITLTIEPFNHDKQLVERQNSVNGIRVSTSSSPIVVSAGTHETLRNALSHNPMNPMESSQSRPPPKLNGILKSSSICDGYVVVNLHRPHINASFGFSIRGGREFSIPLFILKLADNGLAEIDGRMKVGDQIIEINGRPAYGMTHSEAISLIREGGLSVRLLLKRMNSPPPSLDEVKAAMGSGNEFRNIHWKPSELA